MKEEQCKTKLVPIWPLLNTSKIEKMGQEYDKYCPKSKSNNIIFCPKYIRKKRKDLKWINDYFKKAGKKAKGTKKKKSKRGKSRKRKKKKRKQKKKKSTKRKGNKDV